MTKPVKYTLVGVLVALVVTSTCLERSGYLAFFAAGKHLRKREINKALGKLNAAIERNPSLGIAYSFRGLVREIRYEYDLALADYSRAVDLRPEFFGVYASRGSLYEKTQQIDKALKDYNKAVELKPEYSDIYSARARIHARKDDYASARQDFSRGISSAPGTPKPFVDRAITLAGYGLYERALADLDSAHAYDSTLALQYIVRAHVYGNQQQFSRAAKELERYERLQRGRAGLEPSWGALYSDMGDYERALSSLQKAIEAYPESPLPRSLRGLTYARMGQFDDAHTEVSMAVETDTNQAYTYVHLACCWALQDSAQRAIGALQAAVDRGFRDAAVLRTEPAYTSLKADSSFEQFVASLEELASKW